jgi:hypothetical protein
MLLATATDPLTGAEHGIGAWLDELRASRLAETVFGGGWPALVPVALLLAVAVLAAIAQLPLRESSRGDVALACAAVIGWLVVAASTPDLLPADAEAGTREGALAVVLLAAAAVAGLWLVSRHGAIALLALAPVVLLALPALGSRPRVSLLVAGAALLTVLAAIGVLRRVYGRATSEADEVDPPGEPVAGASLISGGGSPTG